MTTAPSRPPRSRAKRVVNSLRPRQLEPYQAFELSFGRPSGLRIILALALLAEKMRFDIGDGVARDRLVAALLDEGTAHRRLALGGGKINAIPAVAAVARG